MAKIIIVNENDEVIGYKERDELDLSDIYRVSGLWITNLKGEMLLAQRALTKSHDPGKWGPAVAGTVEEGEDYATNILKEAKEELGLVNFNYTKGDKIRVSTKYQYFAQWFLAVVDKSIEDFKIQKEEVEQIKWFSREELANDLENNPDNYLKGVKTYLEMLK